jgi:uncharacterized membrane protein
METNRVEAFSDGVLAIAITLLVLDLRVPDVEHGLAPALLDLWPNYAAYVVSFLVIGIMWVNHHAIFGLVARVDRPLLFINLALLLCIAAVPFPTALLAEYLLVPTESNVAAIAYGTLMVITALAWQAIWWWIRTHPKLIRPAVRDEVLGTGPLRFAVGLFFYAASVGVAFWSAPAALLLHFLVAVYYVVDQLTGDRPTLTDA